MIPFIKKKTKVILDTNFLTIPGEFGIDIFSEIDRILLEPYEICVLDKTIEELENLMVKLGKKKEVFNVKLGFIMIKQKGLKTLHSSSTEYTDNAILEMASKNPGGIIVATQDKELREALRKQKIRVVELKQKKYLSLR